MISTIKQKEYRFTFSRFIKNATLLFISAVISVSSIIIIINPEIIKAAQYSEMTPQQKAESWAYYNAFIECFSGTSHPMGGLDRIISDEEANSGDWWSWYSQSSIAKDKYFVNLTIGYFLDGKSSVSGSEVSCGGNYNDWMLKAFTLWGYSNGVYALCDWGWTRSRSSLTGGYGDCRADGDRSGLSRGVGASVPFYGVFV